MDQTASPFPAYPMPAQDYTVETLARYLHLAPQQVLKLAERGRVPGRKVAGQWRFARADIHHWIEQRIGAADEDELLRVEGVLQGPPGQSAEDVSLAGLLAVESIAVPLLARTRNSVFGEVVALAERTGDLWDAEKMAEAVRAREELFPTVLESGVALLHPRRPMASILARPLLALGVSRSGLPFGAPRGGLTDIFFLICSTDDRGHLRTLARLSRVIASPGFLMALREAVSPQAAWNLLANTEATL